MTGVKVGDSVKVRIAPIGCVSNWARMLGQVGIVKDLNDGGSRALVQVINPDGSDGWLSFIAISALEPVTERTKEST